MRRQKLTQKNPNGMRTIPYKSQYKTNVSDSCPVWRSIILLKEEDQPEKTQIGRIARPRSHRHNIVRGPTGQTGRRPRMISPHPSPHISPHLISSLLFPTPLLYYLPVSSLLCSSHIGSYVRLFSVLLLYDPLRCSLLVSYFPFSSPRFLSRIFS